MSSKIAGNALADFRRRAHPGCVVCSSENEGGLGLEFDATENGGVEATFRCRDAFQGYPGTVHGGVVACILDGAMCNCLFACGRAALTAEMKTRFRHPMDVGRQATVSAKIKKVKRPIFVLEAEIIQDGHVKATAEAKYYDETP